MVSKCPCGGVGLPQFDEEHKVRIGCIQCGYGSVWCDDILAAYDDWEDGYVPHRDFYIEVEQKVRHEVSNYY